MKSQRNYPLRPLVLPIKGPVRINRRRRRWPAWLVAFVAGWCACDLCVRLGGAPWP